MSNKFASGIEVSNGVPQRPSISFLADDTTGIFLNSANDGTQSLGISSSGVMAASIDANTVQLFSTLKIANNASTNAVLTSDKDGNANWQTNICAGYFKWSSIYKTLNLDKINNQIDIKYSVPFVSVPSVSISKESLFPVKDLDLYIKNKTETGFSIYSDLFMCKQIITDDIGDYSSVRLSTGGIGICYYNITLDRMFYTYSLNSNLSIFSKPYMIDTVSSVGICSMVLIANKPAIVYVADLDQHSEWRIITSVTQEGSVWNNYAVITTSKTDVTFLSNGLVLQCINNMPVLFMNDETGRAKVFRSVDSGITWEPFVNISNLVKHQILDVKIIQGNPAILAKSNETNVIYYVRSLDSTGIRWPVGATQIYKPNKELLVANVGKCSNTLGIINNTICIISSEVATNSLYIAWSFDKVGNTWGSFELLTTTNTSNAFPRIFTNNNVSSLIYNNYSGTPSEKKVITFTNSTPNISLTTSNSLSLYTDHQIHVNNNDLNNIIILRSSVGISILKYFNPDLTINWNAIVI